MCIYFSLLYIILYIFNFFYVFFRKNYKREIYKFIGRSEQRYHYQFNMSVEEQCKRNPELKMSDLQILKDWMVKQPHLPRVEMLYLILFLYSNYYRIEPFKKTIDNFYTIRILLPEVFSNRDPIA